MSRTAPSPAGPATHYELFESLRDADVTYLVTGAAALVLHGVPRLTPDIDLAAAPDPDNVFRIERLLSSWGYGETGPALPASRSTAVRRFRNPRSALGEIDVVLPAAAEFARLSGRAASASLVDVQIPFVGAEDLIALKLGAGTEAGRADAAGLDALAAIRAGGQVDEGDTRGEQIRKFSRWSVAARLGWLLAATRLAMGLSPEAKPRGLPRRRGWHGRYRDGRR